MAEPPYPVKRHLSSQDPLQPVMDFLRGDDAQTVCTRYGLAQHDLEQRLSAYQESRRQLALEDHFTLRRVGRNEPCPCGSGKKFKKCCLPHHEEITRKMPKNRLKEMEDCSRQQEKLDKEIGRGFDLLHAQDYEKARRMAEKLLETYPEDDRLHDILVSSHLASGRYEDAFLLCRRRWQVALEEKDFYQENGFHKREGVERKNLVHFYSPPTWLEKLWIAQRAGFYSETYPREEGSRLTSLVEKLYGANDLNRFPQKGEEGFEVRRKALAPVLDALEAEGARAIPYLLPLTYNFSWASLFVPDLLKNCGTDDSIRLLGELSMFRFPFFAQRCLLHLESFGERAVSFIQRLWEENPAFDELKVGTISVLGNLRTSPGFDLLTRLIEHPNTYVVRWAMEALSRHDRPEAQNLFEKARNRLASRDRMHSLMSELASNLEE